MYLKEVFGTISSLAASTNKKVYLVGGFVRDLYLGDPCRDLDFAVSGNAMSFAQAVSETFAGAYIPLDRINRVARVVLEHRGEKWQIDFSSFKGLNIEEDLSNRDFTINAMALELAAFLKLSAGGEALLERRSGRSCWQEVMIDPYGGLADIENRIVRAINEYVIEADPIRILRGVRLAGKLGFTIKPDTVGLMEQGCWLLQEVAGERIWDELLGILALSDSYKWIVLLDQIGAISEIFPVGEKMKVTGLSEKHRDDVWTHSLKTFQRLEELQNSLAGKGCQATGLGCELREILLNHLNCALSAGRRRFQLIKLAALFHDPGKVDTVRVLKDGRIAFPNHSSAGLAHIGEIARRLKLSRAEESYLKKMVGYHMYPVYLFLKQPVEPTDIYRFFNKSGLDSTDLLLLSLANVTASAETHDQDLAGYRAFIGDLLFKYYFEADTYVQPPALVKGEDLMKALGLPPSKKVGELLKKISEAQVRGEVTNREQAIALASGIVETWK